MHITGTHFNYYQICHRKLWLFASNIRMEHTSGLVYEGKLGHETSYENRCEKYSEMEIDGIRIYSINNSTPTVFTTLPGVGINNKQILLRCRKQH